MEWVDVRRHRCPHRDRLRLERVGSVYERGDLDRHHNDGDDDGDGARQTAAFQKFAACMKKQGVNVASFGAGAGAGSGAPPTGTPPTGTPPSGTLPSGATAPNGTPAQAANPKFQAAFAACRSVAPQGFGTRRPGAAPNNAQFQKFTACMKSHGVTLPTGGQQAATPIDRTSSTYKKAAAACNKLLPGPGATTTTQGG